MRVCGAFLITTPAELKLPLTHPTYPPTHPPSPTYAYTHTHTHTQTHTHTYTHAHAHAPLSANQRIYGRALSGSGANLDRILFFSSVCTSLCRCNYIPHLYPPPSSTHRDVQPERKKKIGWVGDWQGCRKKTGKSNKKEKESQDEEI